MNLSAPRLALLFVLGASVPAFAQNAPTPFAAWSFDKAENNVFAGSGAKPVAAQIRGKISSAPGRSGNCASFLADPAGQLVVPVDLVSLSKDHAFTVEFWLRLTARPASYGNCVDAGANKGFVIRINNGGRLSLSAAGQWNVLAADTPLVEQAWTHVALVHENGVLCLYANGREIGKIALPDASAIPAELRLGSATERAKQPDGSISESVVKSLAGDIDDLKIHARALTAAEIAKAAR